MADGTAARKDVVTGALGVETLIALTPGAGFQFAKKIWPVGVPPIVIAP